MRKAKDTANKSDEESALRTFLRSDLAEDATRGLSRGAVVALHMGEKELFFVRGSGKNLLERKLSPELRPDLHFWVPLSTLRQLLERAAAPDASIATLGVAIFEKILLGDEKEKIHFRVDAGFLTLWTRGYFSILKAGGPEVASYLARFGFQSWARIKEVLLKRGAP